MATWGRVAPGQVTIGRELGPVGRWIRMVSGLLAVGYGVAGLVGADAGQAALVVGFVLVLAGYYLLLHRLLGERVFARANPWFGTLIVLGSLGVFTAPFMPESLHHAVGLYVGATLVLGAAIGYGGCEVAALPTLLSGRRYVLYCPWNAVDAAERAQHRLRIGLLGAAAAGLTAVVGVYFVLAQEILWRLDLPDPVPPGWALLLLAPAGLLAYHAWAAVRRGAPDRAEARVLGIGAATLLVLALYLAEVVPQGLVWPAVMLGGLGYAITRAIVGAVVGRRVRVEGASGSAGSTESTSDS